MKANQLFGIPLLLISMPAFAAVTVEGLIGLLIWIIVLGLIFWLIWWFLGYVGIPEPFNKIVRVIVGLIAFLILLYLLLGILGPLPRLG